MDAKISVNKLGEYMIAAPSRRKQILRDQKNPPDFKVIRYRAAREAIVQFMEQGMDDDAFLLSKAVELRSDSSGTDFAAQDRQLSAEAIEEFLPLCELIEIDDVSVKAGYAFAAETMELGGTKVSMRPDAILRSKETGAVVGCVKVNFSKSAPLTPKAAEYVATALRAHLELSTPSPAMVNPSLCYVIDVPLGTVCSAPKANKKRLSDLAAAGEEIAVRWDTI